MRELHLSDLAPPPQRPNFHTELWDRIEAAQRATARRLRLTVAAALCVALAGATAAGVLAFGDRAGAVIDRTLACPVSRNGELALFAHVKGPATFVHEPSLPGGGKRIPHPSLLELDANRGVLMNGGLMQIAETTYAGLYDGASVTQKAGYTLDGNVCQAAKTIPFSSVGLRSAGTFSGGQGAGVYRECAVAQPATFRLRLTLGKSGLPTSARLILRGGKKLHPVAYVEWAPDRVRAWLAPGCRQYTLFAP